MHPSGDQTGVSNGLWRIVGIIITEQFAACFLPLCGSVLSTRAHILNELEEGYYQ